MIGAHPIDLKGPRLAHVTLPAHKKQGVYALWQHGVCLYVGYSGHVAIRLRTHRQQLRKGNHPNTALQKLYDGRPEIPLYATLLPTTSAVAQSEELAWIQKLQPRANQDRCPADFHPATRRARREAAGQPALLEAK